MRKLILISAALLAAAALSGCNEEKIQKQIKPDIKEISEVDGCVVKYVDRGYLSDSFYIARCPGLGETVTTTSQTGGKGNVLRTLVTRTETAAEQAAREQKEEDERQKKAALNKLTVEERRLLGL